MLTLPRYQPSGRVSASAVPRLLAAMAGAVLLAGAYEFALFIVPWVYVLFLFVFIFGLAVGFLAQWVVERANVRSTPLALVFTVLVALSGLAASYGWNYRRFVSAVAADNPGWDFLAIARVGVPDWLRGRIEGGWVLGSSHRSGSFVITMWILEALIVFGAALLMVWQDLGRPYCEPCDVWTKSQGLGLPGVARSQVMSLLESANVAAVVELAPRADAARGDSQVVLTRAYCPQCADTAFLSVSEVSYSRNPKGELQEKKEALVKHLVLTRELSQKYAARIAARDAAP